MKKSILHTLLVAMISIFVWSFYTIFQDIQNSRQDWGSQYTFSVGVNNYIPILPQNSQQRRLFPVYKGGNTSQFGSKARSTRSSGSVFSSNTFGISEMSNSAGVVGSGLQNNNTRRASSGQSMPMQQSSLAAPSIKPFSQNLAVSQDRDMALAVTIRQKSSRTLSQSGTMRKAFGEGEGDALTGDGGVENDDAYNDSIFEAVVGDGYSFILILLVIYFLFKNRNKLVYKTNNS